MTEPQFNLADEPWVRVMTQECEMREISLREALLDAHQFKGLSGEMEAQNVAMLRLLAAIVHTIFTRVDPEGEEEPVEDPKEAVSRWAALMKEGRFPGEPVEDYFNKWHDRFWLFHDSFPFYQVPQAEKGTLNTAAKLNGEVSESNNKARLFAFITAEGRRGMSFPESARWLLFINGFDDCAAKQRDKSQGSRSMTTGWLGKLGLVTAVGDTLFETIMLNMPMLTNSQKLWEEDKPVWEKPVPVAEERRTIPVPDNLAELYTLQSRRLLLQKDGETVTGYTILGGDAFSEQNALAEPMTLWRFVEDKKEQTSYFVPRRHDRARQIWRDFGALVVEGERETPPGVIIWCGFLKAKGYLPARRQMTFRISCVRYDSSQSSSITDSFSDALSFRANLLLEAGTAWVKEIIREIGNIESAAGVVGDLASNLAKACGQREDSPRSASDAAKEQFYLAVDLPFRDWLLELDPEQDSEDHLKRIESWQREARGIASRLGRQLVEEKGDIAFIGRTVTEKKIKYHYSSPEAYRWFKYHLSKIYPYTQKGDEQNG